jgi:predicted O-methyltransferase YrrM
MLEFAKQPTNAAQVSFLVSYYRPTPIAASFDNFKNSLSMLHADVLTLLYHFGAYAEGNILELGPFIGGSTIALAWGARDSQRKCRFVTVEAGGAFNHPTMGAKDIVGSLRGNLREHEVEDRVEIVVGNSRAQEVVDQVFQAVPSKSVGLLVIDSDGLVKNDFEIYAPLLSDHAFLVVDDYFCPGNIEKGNHTKEGIDHLEREGVVETLGVFGWGTWVGRMK